MNKDEAQKIQSSKLEDLRACSYADLVERVMEAGPTTEEVKTESGGTYQVQVQGIWDDKRAGHLRVRVAIDDGGWRAFVPLTDDFIIAPDGSFVGE